MMDLKSRAQTRFHIFTGPAGRCGVRLGKILCFFPLLAGVLVCEDSGPGTAGRGQRALSSTRLGVKIGPGSHG